MVIDVVDMQAWMGYLMVLVRISGFAMLFPFFSWGGIPPQLRVFFSMVLALLMMLTLGEELFLEPVHGLEFAGILVNELLTGLALGFMTVMFFSLFMFAGDMIALKGGMMLSGEFDPYLEAQTTILGQFLYIFALVYYLTINGHHYLIRALAHSFNFIPLGSGLFGPENVESVFRLFSHVFILAFQISAPIIIVLMMVDMSLGFLGKTVPQVHVFILGLPIKVVLSVFLLALVLPLLSGVMEVLLERFMNTFEMFIWEWA